MDAPDVMRTLGGAGVHLTLEDGLLIAGPAGRLTDELRELIRGCKPMLVEFLQDAQVTTEQLLSAAMLACDHHGDGEAARDQMRQDCLSTPVELRHDLLDHFTQTYLDAGGGRRKSRQEGEGDACQT